MSRMASWTALLALLALLGGAGACTVRLSFLDPAAAASLAFSGYSQASLIGGRFPVSMQDPATQIGLAGAMYMRLAEQAACPTTVAGFLQAAPGMRVTSAPSGFVYRPVRVFPASLYAGVFGVPLNISGLAFNLTMTGPAAVPASAAALALNVNASVTEGYVFSNTSMTGGASLERMKADDSTGSTTAQLSLQPLGSSGAQRLNLTLPAFSVSFLGRTAGVVNGKPWSGNLTITLAGPVTLTGIVGCPRDCGDFGRCVPSNSSNNSTAAAAAAAGSAANSSFVCECECGWTASSKTGRCEVPAGTCPLYSSSSAALLAGGRSGNGSNSGGECAGDGSVMATQGNCPSRYGFDVLTKTCSRCSDGWGGPGCKLCATDAACQASLSKPDAICSTGLLYNERSRTKYYSCQLNDASIAAVVGPILPITCNTSGPGGPGGPKTPNSALAVSDAALLESAASCAITMRLAGMPLGTSAMCQATGCRFAAGQPSFRCEGVACDCPQGCPASYLDTFKGVSGAVTVDCDVTGQACTIVIGSLSLRISASCEASECLDTSGPRLVGAAAATQSGPPLAPPLLAAVPAALLLLGGLACLAALAKYRAYLRPSSSHRGAGGSSSKAEAGAPGGGSSRGGGAALGLTAAAGPMAAVVVFGGRDGGGKGRGQHQIKQLAFCDVTADVRLPRSWRDVLCGPLRQRRLAAADCSDVERGRLHRHQQQQQQQQQQLGAFGGGDKGGMSSSAGSSSAESGSADADAAAAAASIVSGGGSSCMAGGWKTVLRGVSGCVSCGQVLGIMGPSGGGKSTLLLRLCGSLGGAGRGRDWRSGGDVLVDGVPVGPSLLTAVTALVPQDDSLMRSLTVEECVRYSAALRLDPALPPSAVAARVDGVLAALGLAHVAGSTVLSGTGASGVSGGERRRVAIAMELVIDPQVLVLDEPLSGLDSFTALQLMKTLQAVAGSGRVVALSLHQPSPALFGALDTAMLLAAGLMVYSGPPAAAGAALDSLGCPAPPGITVAEHLLHVVSDPATLQGVVAAALQQRRERSLLPEQQQQQQHQRTLSNDSAALDQAAAGGGAAGPAVAPGSGKPGAPWLHGSWGGGGRSPWLSSAGGASSLVSDAGTAHSTARSRTSASAARELLGLPRSHRPLGRQVAVLFWRGLLDMLRNPLLTAFHALGGLALGVLVGVIFFSVKNDTSGAQNRVGAMFFALCLLAFTSVTSVDLVQAEAGAAGREMRRKYYRPAAYAFTKLVLDGLLLRALPALLFALPFYFLMGLTPAAMQFFVFLLVLVGFSAAVGALALGFSAALNSAGKTILVMNLVLLLGVLFAGFLANKESIPDWLAWLTWLSIFRYAWEALVVNELADLDLFLSAPGVSLSLPMKGGVFLRIIGVDQGLLLADVAVLAGLYVAAAGFVVAVVAWRNRQHRD